MIIKIYNKKNKNKDFLIVKDVYLISEGSIDENTSFDSSKLSEECDVFLQLSIINEGNKVYCYNSYEYAYIKYNENIAKTLLDSLKYGLDFLFSDTLRRITEKQLGKITGEWKFTGFKTKGDKVILFYDGEICGCASTDWEVDVNITVIEDIILSGEY